MWNFFWMLIRGGSGDCFFIEKFKQTPRFFAWKGLLWQGYDPTSYFRQGGCLQFIEAQHVIKQYALYGTYCFITHWRAVCYTDLPSLWPSDPVCILITPWGTLALLLCGWYDAHCSNNFADSEELFIFAVHKIYQRLSSCWLRDVYASACSQNF